MSACQLVTDGVPTWKSLCLTWIRDISTQLEKSPWVCCQGWEWKPWNLGLSAIIARLGSNTFSICFRHDGFSWTKILGGAKKLLHNILYIFYYTLILDCPWHFFLKQAYYIIKTHIQVKFIPGVSILVPWVSLSLSNPPGAGWLDDLADRWAAGAWQLRYSADDASNATGRNGRDGPRAVKTSTWTLRVDLRGVMNIGGFLVETPIGGGVNRLLGGRGFFCIKIRHPCMQH